MGQKIFTALLLLFVGAALGFVLGPNFKFFEDQAANKEGLGHLNQIYVMAHSHFVEKGSFPRSLKQLNIETPKFWKIYYAQFAKGYKACAFSNDRKAIFTMDHKKVLDENNLEECAEIIVASIQAKEES